MHAEKLCTTNLHSSKNEKQSKFSNYDRILESMKNKLLVHAV
jgi:hypothetical protein